MKAGHDTTWKWLGDSAVLIEHVPQDIRRAIAHAGIPEGVQDVVCGPGDVVLYFATPEVCPAQVNEIVHRLLATHLSFRIVAQEHEFVVRYGGEDTDLPEVAQLLKCTEAEVVLLHCRASYRAISLGFAPGFAYLAGLDDRLRLPRKAVPRLRVERGAVAIASDYTAIYPRTGSGGWWILGYTDTARVEDLWRWDRSEPALMRIGDRVTFRPL